MKITTRDNTGLDFCAECGRDHGSLPCPTKPKRIKPYNARHHVRHNPGRKLRGGR